MPVDPRMVEVLSHYREAELHGAALLLRLAKLMREDQDAQVKLTLHIAQETHHAWLWTKRLREIGGGPINVGADYQTRIGRRTMPRNAIDLLALTIVVESRALERYRRHAADPSVDDATRAVLAAVASDEAWHLSWLTEKLHAMTARDCTVQHRVQMLMEDYRRIEEEVYRDLRADDRGVIGDSAQSTQ